MGMRPPGMQMDSSMSQAIIASLLELARSLQQMTVPYLHIIRCWNWPMLQIWVA